MVYQDVLNQKYDYLKGSGALSQFKRKCPKCGEWMKMICYGVVNNWKCSCGQWHQE